MVKQSTKKQIVSPLGFVTRLTTASALVFSSFIGATALGGYTPIAPKQAFADLIADPSAPLGFRPSITSSGSGVPVVNITNPTAGGVSINKFSDFNVGSEGLIHNNSLTAGTSSIGGSVSANPNLSTTASTIIDEVTSSNTSSLEGTIEVFGTGANVIIANPNGITCSGCGVLNIPRFTMTTGTPSITIGGSTTIDFDVDEGQITINGEGLNGRSFQRVDLIARELLINGAIYNTSRLDLVSGAIDYDYSGSAGDDPNAPITEDTSAAATGNTYQIDASAVSEMSAGKINIIGTDNGVGVRFQGNIGTTTGDVYIDADGNLLLEGSITSEMDTTLKTGDTGRTIDVDGAINGGRDTIFDSTGDITIDAQVATNRRITVDANGNDFTNNGQEISGSQMNIQDVDVFLNDDGEISAGVNDLVYEVKATDTTLNKLAASIASQININPGFQGFSAIATTDGSGVINISIDDISATAEIETATPVTNGDAQGFAWASTGANTATLTLSGTIQAGDSYKLSNSGDIIIGSTSNRVTTFTNDGSDAEISSIGGIEVYASGAINNQDGANITADRNIILNSSGGVVNQDATIEGSGDITLEGDTLNLSTDAAKFTRADGVLTLDWNQAGLDFDFSGQQIVGNTGLTFNVPDAFTNSVDLSVAGDITINAASVTVNRDLIAGDDIVITTTGAVTNNDVIYADDGTSGGNGLVIDAGGEIVNSAGKSIYGQGDVVLVSDTYITNAYNSYIEAGGDLTLMTVTGETIADGEVTGGTKVASGYIFNTEGQVTSGGDLDIITGQFANWRGYRLDGSDYVPDDITTNSVNQPDLDRVQAVASISNMGSDSSTPGQSGDTITIRNTSTGHQFTYTLTGSESTDSNSQDNGEELLSVFATEFEEHQSNTGQFDDVESISAYSTGSGNPYGLEFLTDQGSNYQITFSDSSGGSDSFNSPSISSVDGANFGGWGRVRTWRSGGSDYALWKKTTSTQEIASDAYRANVYAGGNITIEATALRNRSSTIEAAGDITLTGTDLTNEKIRLLDVIDWKKGWGSWTAGWGYGIQNSSAPIYSWQSGQCQTENGDDGQNCVGESDADRYQYSLEQDSNINAGGTLNATFTNEVTNRGGIKAQNVSVTATNIQNGLPTGSVINITSNRTNAVSLTPVDLSNLNSLYSYDPSGTSQYLISSSINLPGAQLTADHLISQLTAGAGSVDGLPFLADPFVENRLLRQAALVATGTNFVLENVEANDEAQREALYNNAADFANSRNDVVLGQELTETQQAELTAPVLWYVSEVVDGNEVLVPTLYLPTTDNLDIAPDGTIVAENNIVLQAEETITNTGTIEAGGAAVLQAQDITNETLRTRDVAQTGSGEVGFDTAAGTATISGSNVVLIAESEDGERGNITNVGGAITGTDAEGQVILSASGDIANEALVVQAVEDVEVGNLGKTLGKQDFTYRDEYVSGTIQSAGNLTIVSEGEVTNIASALTADGDVLISARLGFRQENLSDTFTVEDSVNLGGGGTSSSSSSASSEGEGYNQVNRAEASAGGSSDIVSGSYREGFVNQSASVSGANVTIYSAEGDITSIGSSINSSGETILFAEDGSISLQAASIITNSSDFAVSTGGNAQASAGGSGVEYNANAEASATAGVTASSSQDATFIGSTVGGENVTLIAGQDIEGVGAQLAAANNLVLDAGNDVSFTAAQETLNSTSFSAGVTSRVYAEAGTTSGTLGTPDAAAGTDTTVNVGFGASSQQVSQVSSLSAGGNVVVNAGNNIDLVGTDLAAGQDIALTAVNDVTIEALAESSSSFGVGISASVGVEAGSSGVIPTASGSVGVSTSEGTTFRESNVNAGGNFSINAGGNAALTGVNINTGADTNITAAEVTIASAQDTLNETGVGVGISTQGTDLLQASQNDDAPLSFNFNQTDALVTTDQAQINTGGNLNINSTDGDVTLNSLQINTAGDANLTAQGGDVTIGENRDRVDTVGVNIELTVETGLEDTISGLADGIATAVETGDVGAVVGGVPGVNRVAQTIAAIESGDATQIAGALGGPAAGGILSAVDQFALDGEISNNANPTGSSVGNDILAFTGGNSGGGEPETTSSSSTQALALAQGAANGELNIDGDIDARLGVTVTETSAETSVGSTVNVGGDLNVSGENINIVASDVSAAGDTSLIAQETINLVAGVNTFESETIEAGVTVGFDVVNQDVKVGVDGAYTQEESEGIVGGSLTSGGTLTLQSGGDTNILSTEVQATDINVDTGGDLTVATLQDTSSAQAFSADLTVEVGITGDSGAGELNFDGSIQSQSQTSSSQGSLVALNDLNINSEGDINVNSATVGAGNDANLNADGSITFTANIDETNAEAFGGGIEVSANQQGEDSGSGGSAALNFNYSNEEADDVGTNSVLFAGGNLNLNAGNDITLADTQASGDTVSLVAENDVNILTTQSTSENFGVGGDFAAGGGGEDSGESTQAALNFNFNQGDAAFIDQQGTVQAGSNLIIQSGGDTNIIGSEVSSDGDATIDVGGDLTVTTLQDTVDQIDIDGGFTANEGGSDGEAGTANANFNLGLTDQAESNTVAGITVANNLDLTTGGDVTLTGSTIEGGTVDAEIGGDLTVTSLQDRRDNVNVDLNVGTGDDDAGASNFELSAGVGVEDTEIVTTVAGITATSGDLNANVGGTTTLTGGLIASTAEGGQTNLSTENLVVADIQDEVLDVNAGFELSTSQPGAGDQGVSLGGNLGVTEGQGSTVSTIGQGNLVIRSGEEVEVNRDLAEVQTFDTDVDFNLEGNIEVSQSGVDAEGSATINGETVEGSISVGADGVSTSSGEEVTEVAAVDEEETLTPAQRALRQAQEAVNNAGQAQDQGPRATTEQMNQILDQFRVGADVTPIEAQAASDNVFNGGDPATSPVLEGLSPAQQVVVLQQARVWLNSEEQVVLDRAIQQITTGENNTITQDDDS